MFTVSRDRERRKPEKYENARRSNNVNINGIFFIFFWLLHKLIQKIIDEYMSMGWPKKKEYMRMGEDWRFWMFRLKYQMKFYKLGYRESIQKVLKVLREFELRSGLNISFERTFLCQNKNFKQTKHQQTWIWALCHLDTSVFPWTQGSRIKWEISSCLISNQNMNNQPIYKHL